MPLASSTLACEETSGGTSGFWAMPDRNEAVSEVIRIAPASAVPIDAPNCVAVFWSPPTSGLCSSGTAETVTAPSCEARAAEAEPDQQQRHGHDARRSLPRRAR